MLSAVTGSVMMVAGLGLMMVTSTPLLSQTSAGLAARIIEFAGLADDDRAGADDKYGTYAGCP